MAESNQWSNGRQPSGGSLWNRWLQTLAKIGGKGQENRREGQDDRSAPPKAQRILDLAAERERLETAVKETFTPPCPEKIRRIATSAFRTVQENSRILPDLDGAKNQR